MNETAQPLRMDLNDANEPLAEQKNLNRAILSRDFEAAQQLISGGMDVSYGDFQPLRLAAMVGSADLAHMLAERADETSKRAALMVACDNGRLNVLKVLMSCTGLTSYQLHEAFNRSFQRGQHECVLALWEGRDRQKIHDKDLLMQCVNIMNRPASYAIMLEHFFSVSNNLTKDNILKALSNSYRGEQTMQMRVLLQECQRRSIVINFEKLLKREAPSDAMTDLLFDCLDRHQLEQIATFLRPVIVKSEFEARLTALALSEHLDDSVTEVGRLDSKPKKM